MDKPFQPFWSWSECRAFIEAALSHYKNRLGRDTTGIMGY